jgi:outer membrane cobalamin receptor
LRAENDSPHGGVLAPSFGGTIRSGPLRFSGDVGESFRIPTLDDLYYPNYSNPNLLPERAQTADATVAVDTRRATVSAGWFDRNGSNFIVLDPTTFLPVNAQRAQSAGIVLTVSAKPVAGLVAEASFTNLYRALDVTTGARLPGNPVDQSVALALASLPRRRPAVVRAALGNRWVPTASDRQNVTPLVRRLRRIRQVSTPIVRYALAPNAVVDACAGSISGTKRTRRSSPIPRRAAACYVELSTR